MTEEELARERDPAVRPARPGDRRAIREIYRAFARPMPGMVDRNEYKRRQAAPGVRISPRAFGRDRRYPITSGYSEIGTRD